MEKFKIRIIILYIISIICATYLIYVSPYKVFMSELYPLINTTTAEITTYMFMIIGVSIIAYMLHIEINYFSLLKNEIEKNIGTKAKKEKALASLGKANLVMAVISFIASSVFFYSISRNILILVLNMIIFGISMSYACFKNKEINKSEFENVANNIKVNKKEFIRFTVFQGILWTIMSIVLFNIYMNIEELTENKFIIIIDELVMPVILSVSLIITTSISQCSLYFKSSLERNEVEHFAEIAGILPKIIMLLECIIICAYMHKVIYFPRGFLDIIILVIRMLIYVFAYNVYKNSILKRLKSRVRWEGIKDE